MTKKKGIHFMVHYQVYPFDCMVSIGQTDQQFVKVMKKLSLVPLLSKYDIKYEMDDGCRNGKFMMFPGGQSVIRLKYFPTTPKLKGVLAHEILHAGVALFDTIGLTLSESSEEAWAYFNGFLTEQIYKKCK